ncbi:MAG: DNA-directed RNA polymerase subunit alpha [Candidatus Riflebacteria bacterium]|nr:DNA-directed RNA polymerase subunit alpha [Candidatus Riflebacteria bacterium]
MRPDLKFYRDEHNTPEFGRFVLEPLERGYGQTIGNSLRRVLLSSMPGACICAVKMEGVLHEFSHIPGIVEDVTQIILNLKKVVLRSTSDKPVTMYLKATGPKQVMAGDIQPHQCVTIVQPNVYICEITGQGTVLDMEMTVIKGKGYKLAQRNAVGDVTLNTIFLDTHFTPITKVNFLVEDTRVGQDINYDRLILEVTTNGAIHPDEAVRLSAKMLTGHFDLLTDFAIESKFPEEEFRMVREDKKPENKALDIPIKDLEFSVRSRNCLEQENIRTLGELASKRASELLAIKNFGKKSLFEIREKLSQHGLALKDEEVPKKP